MDDDSRGLSTHYREKKLYSKSQDKFQGTKHSKRKKKEAKPRCLRLLVHLGCAKTTLAREAHHPTQEGRAPPVEKYLFFSYGFEEKA